MARFFFDVREGHKFFSDGEGQEFRDIAAAEHEAACAAAEIGRERLPKGDLRTIIVEVRDEQGQRVATATVSLTMERVDPPPEHSSPS
ncbi:DUF6894 family protein [Terrihabitans rhizophilus]|uniref:DUF6894 family protein n=1 Tax=Terrihabitans rhizophilus TaxID=3092662 RepID=UPI003CC53814